MIKNETNLGIDKGLKIIKIPIIEREKVVWSSLKVPVKFYWSLQKIPSYVIIRLARKLAKNTLKEITPLYLQNSLKKIVKDYKLKK